MSIKSVIPMPAAAEFAAEPGPPADARSHARHAARALPQVHSAFVPVLLGALALLLALGWAGRLTCWCPNAKVCRPAT